MMRKYHVRFGGGPMEKGRKGYLASGLPNLAAEIGADLLPGRFEETDPFTWIEEYPPPTSDSLIPVFSRIVFASYSPRIANLGGVERTRLGRPQWQPIGQREVAALIGNGETFPTVRLPRHARGEGP